MKRLPLLTLGVLLWLGSAQAATITSWTFETPNVPGSVTGQQIGGLLPALGTGEASGWHANAATAYSSQLGNGSASALNATAWSVGDYWQFHTSTLGYNGLHLSWDQVANPVGSAATNFSLSFSTDGQHFTVALDHYQVYRNSSSTGGGGGVWNATTAYPNYTRTLDLSAIAGLQDAPDVYFRLSSNVSGTDYSRIDNFTLSGTAIPEPGTLTLLGMAVLLGAWSPRRR